VDGEGFNWGAAIGPGTLNTRRMEDDLAFVAALKQIRPEDIMSDSRAWGAEQEEERRARANHPTIHCNRFEEPGNVSVNKPATIPALKPFGAMMTVPEDVVARFEAEFPEAMKRVVLEPSHEPHGAGSQDLPDVVSPEEWVDRFTHLSATKAILLLEAGFLRSVPQTNDHGTFIETTIPFVFDGRVWDIVRQKYLDVGWKTPMEAPVLLEPGNSAVRLYFP